MNKKKKELNTARNMGDISPICFRRTSVETFMDETISLSYMISLSLKWVLWQMMCMSTLMKLTTLADHQTYNETHRKKIISQ